MNTNDNRQNAHNEIDHIFKDLLPNRGMAERAVQGEYLPLLSGLLLEDGMITRPLQAVIRKGKSHYVCDARLERRLGQLNLQKKNWKAGAALLTLRKQLDMSEAPHLSGYDRERVCVPKICDCGRETCRYLAFWEDCNSGRYLFQICNHNLLLADAIHRGSGRRPILPDACALIVDEAHKLPEAARQMFGVTLAAEDIRTLTHSLRGERFLLAAEVLTDSAKSLLRKLDRPPEGKTFDHYAKSLAAPERSLTVIDRQLHSLLTPATRRRLDNVSSTVSLFHQGHPDMVFYIEEDTHGGTMLCATISDLTAQLRQTLWRQERPAILTSATLAVGEDFRRFKEETGLLRRPAGRSPGPCPGAVYILRRHVGGERAPAGSRSALPSVHHGPQRHPYHGAVQGQPRQCAAGGGGRMGGLRLPRRLRVPADHPPPALRRPGRSEGKRTGEPSQPPLVHPGGGGAGDADQAEAGLRAGHPHRDGHLRGGHSG